MDDTVAKRIKAQGVIDMLDSLKAQVELGVLGPEECQSQVEWLRGWAQRQGLTATAPGAE